MFYGIYKSDDMIHCGFYDFETWYRETWSPDVEVLNTIDLTVHGKNYAERKSDVIQKAHDFEDLFTEYGVPMSYGEYAMWGDYFTTQGRRYGLLTEFRENAIPA